MSTTRSELQRRARGLILQHAFLRWESAVVLAGTILLTVLWPRPFPWWPMWGWPVFGIIALVAIAFSSLTDSETNARVIQQLFERKFDPGQIKDAELQDELRTALEYQRRIESHLHQQRPGVLRDRLEDTAGRLSDWIANIFRLAARLDAYRRDTLLASERKDVPREIRALAERRARESDPRVLEDIDDALRRKNEQLQTLQSLDARMRQAELQLDQSHTALATVYSQVQLVDAQDVESGRSDRLHAGIQDQVARLNELISSINEVYDYRGPGLQ